MQLIDGKALAASLLEEVAEGTRALAASSGITPGLAVILVGEDPASEIYVRRKLVQVAAAGMASFEHRLPATTTQAELLALIGRLNRDAAVHGILVQLPLPPHIQPAPVLMASIPPRMSMAFTRSMSGGFPPVAMRWCPAPRLAASACSIR